MSVAPDHDGFGPYTAEDLHAREDEGRGLELEDGWLIELSPSTVHNIIYRKIHEAIETAIEKAGASAYADRGGDWEITTPSGIRKPDVFVAPGELVEDAFLEGSVELPGEELLLVVEVVSPGSGSERTDQVRKVKEYAALGIPQYWIAKFSPHPQVQVFILDAETGAYHLTQTAIAGQSLKTEIQADVPVSVSFDPEIFMEFRGRRRGAGRTRH
ncbi:Uma2 family endonuclease [Spirillospora albida]|uniref:Uma2 family endonuclease n=1 Tax=Spirillospora albida TaxID=58123 RepID=UPI00068E0CAB|nr:Uma2 family endonuclease [Spirillospora albida]